MDNIADLPLHVKLIIFNGLTYDELIKLKAVSKKMRDSVNKYFTTKEGKKIQSLNILKNSFFSKLNSNLIDVSREKSDAIPLQMPEHILNLCKTVSINTLKTIENYLDRIDYVQVRYEPHNWVKITLKANIGKPFRENRGRFVRILITDGPDFVDGPDVLRTTILFFDSEDGLEDSLSKQHTAIDMVGRDIVAIRNA